MTFIYIMLAATAITSLLFTFLGVTYELIGTPNNKLTKRAATAFIISFIILIFLTIQ